VAEILGTIREDLNMFHIFKKRHMHIKSKKKVHFCVFMNGLDCRDLIPSSDTSFLFHFVQTGPFVQLTPSSVDIADFAKRKDART
jgi:hypothetical protein